MTIVQVGRALGHLDVCSQCGNKMTRTPAIATTGVVGPNYNSEQPFANIIYFCSTECFRDNYIMDALNNRHQTFWQGYGITMDVVLNLVDVEE